MLRKAPSGSLQRGRIWGGVKAFGYVCLYLSFSVTWLRTPNLSYQLDVFMGHSTGPRHWRVKCPQEKCITSPRL